MQKKTTLTIFSDVRAKYKCKLDKGKFKRCKFNSFIIYSVFCTNLIIPCSYNVSPAAKWFNIPVVRTSSTLVHYNNMRMPISINPCIYYFKTK